MLKRAVIAGCAAAALAGGPAPAAATELVVRTTADPFNLAFVERSGRALLTQSPGLRLGFRTPAGWAGATRVVTGRRSGSAYSATLATSDPLGRRLKLRIEPGGEGVIALRAAVTGAGSGQVTQVGIGFRARPGERYLGFGERSNAVDQRGREVENYVAEGAFEADERALVPSFVPAWGFRPRDDATYFPMPWLLSTAGYGVLVDNAETSRFAWRATRRARGASRLTPPSCACGCSRARARPACCAG